MGPRRDRLSTRIAVAFAAVALLTVAGVGATLFVALRSLHADTTRNALAQTSQPLVFQLRGLGAATDLRQTVADLAAQVSGENITIHVVTAAGRVVDLGGGSSPMAPFPIDPAAAKGVTLTGSALFADGRQHLYAATTLRGPAGLGPRAIVLSQPDTSGQAALGDLARTLPLVVVLLLVIGAPIAWLLSRSVTGPLRRLAAATADLPVVAADPLPPEGPVEVQELTTRFNAMAAELNATRQSETRLLADLRHDLRTPLTVISGFATALADGTASGPAAARAAEAIGEEADRLARLVAELDTLERLRGGAAGMRPEQLDAAAVVAETVARFAAAAASRGIVLSTGGDDPGLTFIADRMALDRMLGNLVQNALTAVGSPGGHVWVEARPAAPFGPTTPGRPAPASGPGVALSVTDDGPGFAPGETARVFERFYRGDPSRSGSGSGLGLAIVRELARAHGGEAIAENIAPHGARISVVLPQSGPSVGSA